MPLTRAFRRIARLFCLIGSLPLMPLYGQAATADDYLRQIEVEAKQLAATPIAAKADTVPKATAVANPLDAAERLPPDLHQEAFEKALRDLHENTYVFYQRLSPEDKRKIFDLYKQDSRITTLYEQTLRLLSSSAAP